MRRNGLKEEIPITPAVILVVFLSSLAYISGGFVVLFKKNWEPNQLTSLVALSAGLLLAIAILDLIPDTQKDLANSSLFVLLGFLIMYGVFLLTKRSTQNQTKNHEKATVTGLSIGMLLHNFFEGMSMGMSFSINFKLGILISLALIIHKIPEGLSYSSAMLASLNDRKKTAMYLVIQGLLTFCGAGAALLLSSLETARELLVAIALSISAGIFLYLAGTTLLPLVNQKSVKKTPLFFVGGILLYFLLHSLSEAF